MNFASRFAFAFLLVLIFANDDLRAQGREDLDRRLADFLDANRKLDLDRIVDFTYPKVFELAPREAMVSALEDVFANPEMQLTMDSLKIDSIYPIFGMNKGVYTRVDYSFLFRMRFLNKEDTAGSVDANIIPVLEQRYGAGTVRFTDSTQTVTIRMNSVMVAIHDSLTPEWCFMDLNNDPALAAKSLDKPLLDRIHALGADSPGKE